MSGRFGLLGLLAIAIFFGCANSVFAQAGAATARLSGTVTDPSGAVIVKAEITVRNTDTNISYTATSNDSGFYTVPSLPPGNYELKTSYTGFAGYTQTGIILTVGQSATVDIALQLAAEGAKVVVTTEVPTIEPTKTEISQVVGTQQIQSLPISGRLFTDFALLTPGVATSRTSLGTTFTEFEVTQISFGGMRSFSNEITVDGADFVNELSGVQRATPPQDSVQEFRVVNNSFGAEYGRAVGGIVNIVTKSGTNELHGSIYDYLQNSATDSRSLLQPAPLPHELRQNQFGATLGGPLVKDKTFFFMNYEGKRRAESPTYPPQLVCFTGPGCSSSGGPLTNVDLAKAYLGLAPEGCTSGLASCNGSDLGYLSGFLRTNNNDYGFARFDHQINTNNRLAIRYVAEDARNTGALVGNTLDGGGIGVPSGGRNLFIRDQSVVGTLDSTLTPNVVNTALVQYARRHYTFPGATGQPDLSLPNLLEFGHNFGTYDAIHESRIEGSDSVSWVKGNHLAKFGFDGNHVWDWNHYPGFDPARIIILNTDCLNAFANFVKFGNSAEPAGSGGLPTTTCPPPVIALPFNGVVFAYFGIALPRDPTFTSGAPLNNTNPVSTATWANAYPPALYSNYTHSINHGYWGVFAQDQWRITSKLTFNYGLRWDFESGLGEYVAPDYKGFQPRVGLAYSPDRKTVIRAGFGMFDDRYNLTFFFTLGNQKTVPGYLCDNNAPASVAATCNAAGILPQKLPMIQTTQVTAGWQLAGFPGSQGAAAKAASVLATGMYPFLNPVTIVGTCFTTGACGIGAGGMDHKANPIPYAEQASAEIDRQFGGGFALNLGYLFTSAHRLVRGNNLNVPCPVGTTKPASLVADPLPEAVPGWVNPDGSLTPCTGTPTLGPFGLGPFFAGAFGSGLQTLSAGLWDYNNGVANAAYHGLTVTAIEKWGKYLNLTANYTYSHTIDNGNFTTFINLPPNQFDYASERANSNQDVRHHFVANFTLAAPKDSFLRNFEFSSIVTLQSGRPFTLFPGSNTLNDLAGSATDRVGGAPVVGSCPSVDKCATMIGRNTYIGDPMRAWDLRVSRRGIHLTERLKVDLMMDIFNVMNRANVDEVTSVYGSPIFCGTTPTIPHHYNDATTLAIQAGAASAACGNAGAYVAPAGNTLIVPGSPNPSFGTPRTMLNPRQFQFAAKFSF
jgi:Carboxypeptidase regulatory-like domain/TonB dependent receptor